MNRIIGNFVAQQWEDHDQLVEIYQKPFDATDSVLAMSLDDIHAIEDHRDSSDMIGREYIEHDGPFEVEVEESIREFFSVDDLSEITEDRLLGAREAYLPKADTGATWVRMEVLVEVPIGYDHADHDSIRAARAKVETAAAEAFGGKILDANASTLRPARDAHGNYFFKGNS